MSNTRTATWENIGTDVSSASKVNDVLMQAHLDYEVHKEPVQLESGFIVPNYVATVKDDGSFMGMVGSNYEICQNTEAFSFVDYIDAELDFVKAGETHTGLIYIIAKMPEFDLLGDTVEPYILFQNSHNGRYTIKACISPLRIVCQNQLAMSFKNSSNTINIRHSQQMNWRLESAKHIMASTADYINNLKAQAEHYAGIKLSESEITRVIKEFFPLKDEMSDKQKNNIEKQRADFIRAYNEEDNFNFRGTAWSLINAYSDYLTHRPTKQTKNIAENQFMAVTLSPNFANFLSVINSVGVAA